MKRLTVAIVGRPNVGKSTLFNRIVGGRRAIVHERPGVTRDRQFGRAHWAGRDFWLVDTGGWIPESDTLSREIRRQIDMAISTADVILFVVDAREGVHPADEEVAALLRPLADRVLVVANKADDPAQDVGHYALHALGLGTPIPVSAASGRGTGDLLDRLADLLPEHGADGDERMIQVAILGRPNVGKSSLMNRLLGADRAVVAPDAGTTRDAVDSPLRYHGRTLNFIDTAGLRKRSKVEDEVEFYSTLRTERAVEQADVCVLVVDAAAGINVQDLRVATKAWDRGAGLIVAVNKWDLIEEKDAQTAYRGEQTVVERAPFLAAVPFVYLSAVTGQRVRKVLDLIVEVADARQRRIPTAEVNRVLADLVQRQQPPQKGGQEVKLLYGSQIGVAPPTFALVANRAEAVPESYERFLAHGFREAWGFPGTPIRLKLRRKKRRDRRES